MTDFNQHKDMGNLSLKTFFESKTLTELGVYGQTLTVSVNYEACRFEKTGLLAFVRKIPLLKGLTPFRSPTLDMDIDLSCVVLDGSHQVLDKIWYAKCGGLDESVRHVGSLVGANNFEETLMPQELIHVKLSELPKMHKSSCLSCQVIINIRFVMPKKALQKSVMTTASFMPVSWQQSPQASMPLWRG